MVDDSLVNEETTGNHIKIAPKVPEGQLIYTSSPTLILESIATILSKPLAYSRVNYFRTIIFSCLDSIDWNHIYNMIYVVLLVIKTVLLCP